MSKRKLECLKPVLDLEKPETEAEAEANTDAATLVNENDWSASRTRKRQRPCSETTELESKMMHMQKQLEELGKEYEYATKALEKIGAQATCPVCFLWMEQAVFLGCHTICMSCKIQLEIYASKCETVKQRSDAMRCPCCRSEIVGKGFRDVCLGTISTVIKNYNKGTTLDSGFVPFPAESSLEKQVHALRMLGHAQKLLAKHMSRQMILVIPKEYYRRGLYFVLPKNSSKLFIEEFVACMKHAGIFFVYKKEFATMFLYMDNTQSCSCDQKASDCKLDKKQHELESFFVCGTINGSFTYRKCPEFLYEHALIPRESGAVLHVEELSGSKLDVYVPAFENKQKND